MNVLVATDIEPMARSIENQLQTDGGMAIEQRKNGAGVLNAIRHRSYELLVVDADLPGMEDLGLLAAIKSLRGNHHLPVVLLTGAVSHANLTRASRFGVGGIVSKPFTAAALRQKIDQVTARTCSTM